MRDYEHIFALLKFYMKYFRFIKTYTNIGISLLLKRLLRWFSGASSVTHAYGNNSNQNIGCVAAISADHANEDSTWEAVLPKLFSFTLP